MTTPNYYLTLSLPPPPAPMTPESLKKAYHAALLNHHPDKQSSDLTGIPPAAPSIDAIKHAYAILSSPSSRAEHNRALLLAEQQHPIVRGAAGEEASHGTARGQPGRVLGNEVVDLDDMTPSESGTSWRRACRCGDPNGYVLEADELETVAESGHREVLVLCGGCSLGIRVIFDLVDEEEGQCGKDGGARRDAAG